MRAKKILIIGIFGIALLFCITPKVYADDTYEPNNWFDEAKTLVEGKYINFNCSDTDMFNVTLPADSTIIANITFDDTNSDLDLYLYDETQTEVDSSGGLTGFEEVSYYSASGEICTIEIDPFDISYNDYELYNLSIGIFSGNVAGDSITLVNPSVLSSWNAGSNMLITWTWSGTFTNVRITLWENLMTTPQVSMVITSNAPNTGSYSWSIPYSIQTKSDYGMVVEDASNPMTSDGHGPFTIINAGIPSITITNPTFSSIWNNGSSYNINWTSTGSITNIDIDLFNSAGWLEKIVDDSTNDGTYSWLVGNYPSETDYYINITNSNDDYIHDVSNDFAINNTNSPIELIIVTNPLKAGTWYKGDTYKITWVWSGIFSNVNITLHNNTSLVQTIATNAENNGVLIWTIPNNITNGNLYYIEIFDSIDSTPLGQSYNFTITDKPVEGDDDDDSSSKSSKKEPLIPGYPSAIILIFTISGIIGLIFQYTRKKRY